MTSKPTCHVLATGSSAVGLALAFNYNTSEDSSRATAVPFVEYCFIRKLITICSFCHSYIECWVKRSLHVSLHIMWSYPFFSPSVCLHWWGTKCSLEIGMHGVRQPTFGALDLASMCEPPQFSTLQLVSTDVAFQILITSQVCLFFFS